MAWYEREFEVPRDSGPRWVLTFGAADWQATVWINGREIGSHEGGYSPFLFDITAHIEPGTPARLTVRAVDRTDRDLPTGKQVDWYTPAGGIWQTVYIEPRGESEFDHAHIYPDIDHERARIVFQTNVPRAGSYEVRMRAPRRRNAHLRRAITTTSFPISIPGTSISKTTRTRKGTSRKSSKKPIPAAISTTSRNGSKTPLP